MSTHEELVRSLLAAISRSASEEELAAYWHPDAAQVEYPSLMRPAGHTRAVAEMFEGYRAGVDLIRQQQYDVHTVVDDGARLAVQLTWTATTAIDAGSLAAGTQFVAHVAIFYEFKEGRIFRQSSYDCYEPFSSAA